MAEWGLFSRLRERWVGAWIEPSDPTREREVHVEITTRVTTSLRRWPVWGDLEGTIDVEGGRGPVSIGGAVELVRRRRGVGVRYTLSADEVGLVVERRLDVRDPYGSMTVLVGTLHLRGVDCRVLLRSDPRDR